MIDDNADLQESYGNAGGNVFALRMGVPEEQKENVINALIENVKANNGHFDTGIFGTRFFFEVLAENGDFLQTEQNEYIIIE